eukprot:TRINITY_DN19446_c0_g1_i1.p1 TRINITY_DN19446_c0_g1~~TRINITY_DN19446_c0_g1_i1.p1  ORF type:complete len:476 (+),score=177.01 TRINITY_DN19446_c0_g1_i1:84-1430(+)
MADAKQALQQHEQLVTKLLAACATAQAHRQQMDAAHAKAAELLAAAIAAARASAQGQPQAWPQALEMPQPELCRSDPPTDLLSGLRALQAQLGLLIESEGTQVDGDGWAALYQPLFESVSVRAAEADRFLGDCPAGPNGEAALAQLPQGVLQRLRDLARVGAEIAGPAESARVVRSQLADLTRAQALPMDKQAGGQVEWAKVQLQTRLISFLKELLVAVEEAEAENARLGDVAEVRRQAEAEAAVIMEPRWKVKAQAEQALAALRDSLQRLDREDTEAALRHSQAVERSEASVAANLQRQAECWQQIDALQQELQRLGALRQREGEWQVEEHAREAQRREAHKWAHKVADEHRRRLEHTLRHCEGALRCVATVDMLVTAGSDEAQRRHELVAQELAQTKIAVLAEKEQELLRLQQWGGEHRVTVSSTLYDAAQASPVPFRRLPPSAAF